MAVLERAKSAHEVAVTGVKMLVYGPPGAGKTTLARTAKKPTLVLDFEGGVLALLGEPEVLVCPIEGTQDLLEAVKELASDTKFKTVMFDGLSLFVRKRVQELRGNKERVTWTEWQQLTAELRAAILPLLHLNKHLIFTALPRYRDTEKGMFAEPDLTPALRSDLVAACDLVGYLVAPNDKLFQLDQNEGQRVIVFESERVVTKSRIPGLKVAPADISQILKIANLPELQLTPSKVTIVVPNKQERAEPKVEREQAEPKVEREQVEQDTEQSDRSLTSRVFEVARACGLTNQALGRLAKQYFGKSFVKDLTDEQKQTLIDIMQKQARKKSEPQPQPEEHPAEASDIEASDIEASDVEEFIRAWRIYRGHAEPFPGEIELARLAVEKNLQPDELESIVLEKLLELGIDLPISDQYFMAGIDDDTLQKIILAFDKQKEGERYGCNQQIPAQRSQA